MEDFRLGQLHPSKLEPKKNVIFIVKAQKEEQFTDE